MSLLFRPCIVSIINKCWQPCSLVNAIKYTCLPGIEKLPPTIRVPCVFTAPHDLGRRPKPLGGGVGEGIWGVGGVSVGGVVKSSVEEGSEVSVSSSLLGSVVVSKVVSDKGCVVISIVVSKSGEVLGLLLSGIGEGLEEGGRVGVSGIGEELEEEGGRVVVSEIGEGLDEEGKVGVGIGVGVVSSVTRDGDEP